MGLKDVIEKGHLREIEPNIEFAFKEWKESELDLKTASSELKAGGFKWSIIKSYYSMFHAAKAVLFKAGFREKTHYAVVFVLQDFAEKGLLEQKFIEDYKAAIFAREQADYHYSHSRETALQMLEIAGEFIAEMKKLYEKA